MNIVQFGNFSSAAVNGVAVAGYALAQAQFDLGHKVSIYSIDSTEEESTECGGIIKKQFARHKRPFQLPAALTATIDRLKNEIDIFHLHSVFTPTNFALSRYLQKKGIPFVLTPHGGYDMNIFERNRLKKTLYWHLFEKRCLDAARGVICVAEREIKDIRSTGYKGSITTIADPVQRHIPQSRRMEPTVIFLGRWDIQHKGLDRLLELFRHIETIDPSIRLELYGGGQRSELENYAKKLQLRSMSLCDPVFGTEKWSILSRAAIYIQPSRWEVFGLSIVEAMMAGIPVAVARECYLSNAVERVGCGLVLEEYGSRAAQQIVDLIHDRNSNLAVGNKGRAYASAEFDPKFIAQKTCDYYESLLMS